MKGRVFAKLSGAVLGIIAILATATFVLAQIPPVKNPTAVSFTSVDHANAAVTGYEVDIVVNSTNAVLQTIAVAKSATTVLTNGDIRIGLNVQPIAFGTYRIVVRTIAGTVRSSDSVSSDPFERSPGAPSKPVVQ